MVAEIDYFLLVPVTAGLLLAALIATSAWLISSSFYYAIVALLTLWSGWHVFNFGSSGRTAAELLGAAAVFLAVYLLLLYVVTYKYLLREPCLAVVHPEHLKVVLRNRPTSFIARMIVSMPWISAVLGVLAVAITVFAD